MQQDKVRILSTRPLSPEVIADANAKGFVIDTLSFIHTESLTDPEISKAVNHVDMFAAVIFTSMNAVEAVKAMLGDKNPSWKIYCIGNTTKTLIEKYFPNSLIIGTAADATSLAKEVLLNKEISEVVFFCGNQRRDELPASLSSNDVEVKEVVVYSTYEVWNKVNENYDGILFFSPSAVNSFFAANKIVASTVAFAIGQTTAAEIGKHSSNRVVVSDKPGKEALVNAMMSYYKSENKTLSK